MDLLAKISVPLRRLGGYVLTGGSAAVVDLGVFAVLSHGAMPIPAAAAFSFCVAALENYVLTSLFVFRETLSLKRLASFLLFALIGLGVNVGVTLTAVSVVGLAPVIAKIVGIAVAFFVNFWLNSRIVFRKPVVAP